MLRPAIAGWGSSERRLITTPQIEKRRWLRACLAFQRPASDIQAAAAINRTLVEAGHAVHHLNVESASLEEVFLRMTQSEIG